MRTCTLINLPRYDTDSPPAALAILQSICNQNNVKSYLLDFNIVLFKSLTHTEWSQLDDWCMFLKKTIPIELQNKIIKLWEQQLVEFNLSKNDIVGVSIFSYYSLPIAKLLIPILRKYTKALIVLGGNGCTSKFMGSNEYFDKWINQNNFADFIVYGDGEPGFHDILNNKYEGNGINDKQSVVEHDLNNFPIPSYKNFPFEDYTSDKIYITGSRGCVRKCTFCDIANIWPTFRYRSAENLVKEIKQQYYEHGITLFDFTDSLINGSQSNFYKFNCLLAEEKQKHPELKEISYIGQAICKPKSQTPDHHFEAMYYGGCKQMTIGLESFSESVRNHMKKKFSNTDIDYHLEKCSEWGIENVFLMLTGYPTETINDHYENLNGLSKYQKYAKNGTITMIRWGYTMHLYSDTPITKPSMLKTLQIHADHRYQDMPEIALIGHNAKQENIEIIDYPYTWISDLNPSLDLKERIRRRIELHELTCKLNYPQANVHSELETVYKLSKQLTNS